jgi:hypothetical protein
MSSVGWIIRYCGRAHARVVGDCVLEVMGTRIGTLGVLAALAAVTASAQPYRLGRALSTEFLTRLVQQRLLPSQVAIVNASVGSLMILDGSASGPVTFIDGAGNFIWAQIAEQLSDSVVQEEPMHLKIEHRSIDVASCPAMTEHIGEFIARLDALVPSSSDRSSTSIPQEVIVDATAFRIITSGRDALVTIEPNGSLDPPLQQAAGRLHSAVSRCAASVIPQIQRHDF